MPLFALKIIHNSGSYLNKLKPDQEKHENFQQILEIVNSMSIKSN